MKLVDVPDSKSGVVHPTCRFDSGLRHFLNTHLGCFLVCKQQTTPTGVEPPVLTSHKTILNRFARQSGLRHFLNTHLGCFLVCKQQITPTGVEPPVLTSHKTILNRFARQSGLRHFLKAPFKVLFWYHFPRPLRERARGVVKFC